MPFAITALITPNRINKGIKKTKTLTRIGSPKTVILEIKFLLSPAEFALKHIYMPNMEITTKNIVESKL